MKEQDMSGMDKARWHQIGREYWVTTNTLTRKKCEQLKQIASALGKSHLLKAEVPGDKYF